MSQTLLVTGAAGFIGSHLVERLLDDGHRVVGFDNLCPFYDPGLKRRNLEAASKSDRFAFVEADLRDRAAVFEAFHTHRPDRVMHLAAMAGVRPSIENPAYYTAVNLDGTVHLLDAAVEHRCRGFVFASSSSVYGNNDKVPFAEADPVDHPISPYAATKKAGELIGHTYSHLHQLPFIGLRFFTVFGPRQRPDLAIAKFLRLVADDQTLPVFGDGTTSRDYTYIDDIIAGVVAAIDKADAHTPYRIYNLGGSAPVELNELIETVGRVVGKRPRIERRPMQPGDVQRTWADLTRSRAELGYEPQTPIEKGIERQWQALRAS